MEKAQEETKKRKTPLTEAAKEAALDYIKAHKMEDNTWSNIREYISKDDKVKEIKKKRSSIDEIDSNIDENDKEYLKKYDDITTRALKELEAEEKIKTTNMETEEKAGKRKRKRKRYILEEKSPAVFNLYNRDIAVFEVTEGNSQLAADIIKINTENKDLVVIPVGQFLLCTIKNSRNDNSEEKQLKRIRSLVKNALRKSESKVRSNK